MGALLLLSTTDIVVTRSDFNDYEGLKQLEYLRRLDLSALHLTAEEYDTIAAQVDSKVKVIWSVPVGEKRILNTETDVSISPDELPELAKKAGYFPALAGLSVEGVCPLSEDLANAMLLLRENHPDLSVNLQSQVYGVNADSSMDKLTLDNIAIDDLTQLRWAIKVFSDIKTYEMCECGLSDDVMGGLREEYPDLTFTWVVHCGRFRVRTDAQVFSTLEYVVAREYTEKTFSPIFKYCTELRALDVGHHSIVDISELANLKKLQVLILTDNFVQDISPLAELPDLVFVELDMNKIKDASPLQNNEKLEDVCLMFNSSIKNISAVAKLPHLKRLYISNCIVYKSEMDKIKANLPKDCDLNTTHNSMAAGWRWGGKTPAIRKTFAYWRKVKEYHSWDDVVYD